MADLERGQRIKALRKAKAERSGARCTQQDMADATGVSLRAAQEWDYGGGIDDDHLPKLVDFLETDADYLLRGGTPDLMGELNGQQESPDELRDQLDRIEAMLADYIAATLPIILRLSGEEPGEQAPGSEASDQ